MFFAFYMFVVYEPFFLLRGQKFGAVVEVYGTLTLLRPGTRLHGRQFTPMRLGTSY